MFKIIQILKSAALVAVKTVVGWWNRRVNVLVTGMLQADATLARHGVNRIIRRVAFIANYGVAVLGVASGLHLFTFVNIFGKIPGFMIWLATVPTALIGINIVGFISLGVDRLVKVAMAPRPKRAKETPNEPEEAEVVEPEFGGFIGVLA